MNAIRTQSRLLFKTSSQRRQKEEIKDKVDGLIRIKKKKKLIYVLNLTESAVDLIGSMSIQESSKNERRKMRRNKEERA